MSIQNVGTKQEPIKEPTTIFIEGNTGAGKSTLINYLAKYDFIKAHFEPVNKWQNLNGYNLLNLSFEDPTRYSFMFQSYAMLTMVQRHLTDSAEDKINVMERSVASFKNCFVQALIENKSIEPPFAEVIHQWFHFVRDNFRLEPRFIIYLKTTPENLLVRIKQRGRAEEKHLSLQFLQELHRLHENYIRTMENKCKILTIDANTKLTQETLNQILYFIKEARRVD